jgi:hypothetical protein
MQGTDIGSTSTGDFISGSHSVPNSTCICKVPTLHCLLAELKCTHTYALLRIRLLAHTPQFGLSVQSSHRFTTTMSGQFIVIGGIRVDISQFDLSDTSSKAAEVRTANIILISLVVVVVSLRLFARVKFVRRIFADDGKKYISFMVHWC